MTVAQSGSLVQPTGPGALSDFQMASMRNDSGTVSQRVYPGPGASFGASSADQSAFVSGTSTGGIAMGVYQSSPDTIGSGTSAAIAIDTNRNTKVVEQYAPLYEDNTIGVAKVEQRFSYYTVAGTGAVNGTVKSGAGFLHTAVVNKHVTTGTITIYDSIGTSATQIAQFVTGAALVTDPPLTATFNVSFATGLTIVTSGAQGVTLSYR